MLDLKKDIRSHILATLPHDAGAAPELLAMSIPNLLCRFLNWKARIPQPARYRLRFSPTFSANPKRSNYSVSLSALLDDMRGAQPLWKYLSRQVATHGYVVESTSKSRDKDWLLNDWGIHHLHVGMITDLDGFVSRSRSLPDVLLYVAFKRSTAYVIDLGDHSDLVGGRVIRSMIDAWPDEELALELGVQGVCRSTNDRARYELRKSGCAGHMVHNGKVYVSRTGGVSTAGTNLDCRIQADFILRQVGEFERMVGADPSFLRTMFHQSGLRMPVLPQFRFKFRPHGFGAVERTTGVYIPLDRPNYGLRIAA